MIRDGVSEKWTSQSVEILTQQEIMVDLQKKL
jgi:hypothetical protein